MQESFEAAQRADVHNPNKLAAAGTTATGQTSAERMEAMKQHSDPEVSSSVLFENGSSAAMQLLVSGYLEGGARRAVWPGARPASAWLHTRAAQGRGMQLEEFTQRLFKNASVECRGEEDPCPPGAILQQN